MKHYFQVVKKEGLFFWKCFSTNLNGTQFRGESRLFSDKKVCEKHMRTIIKAIQDNDFEIL
jgi:hypothetical protein